MRCSGLLLTFWLLRRCHAHEEARSVRQLVDSLSSRLKMRSQIPGIMNPACNLSESLLEPPFFNLDSSAGEAAAGPEFLSWRPAADADRDCLAMPCTVLFQVACLGFRASYQREARSWSCKPHFAGETGGTSIIVLPAAGSNQRRI